MFDVFVQYHELLFQGFFTTLKLLGSIMLFGIPAGVCVGVIGGRYLHAIEIVIDAFQFLTKVIPVLVLLFWLHFPLQAILGIVINPFWTTVVALGFINFVATAFIVKNELGLMPRSCRDAGATLGMSNIQIVRYIELPMMFRRIVPEIVLNQAVMLEYTLLASLISVPELFRVAQTINAIIYDPVAVYSLLVVFFLVIFVPLNFFSSFLNRTCKMDYV